MFGSIILLCLKELWKWKSTHLFSENIIFHRAIFSDFPGARRRCFFPLRLLRPAQMGPRVRSIHGEACEGDRASTQAFGRVSIFYLVILG